MGTPLILRPLPERRVFEVRLSRRALRSAASSLALAAGLLFLGGLLVGLSWAQTDEAAPVAAERGTDPALAAGEALPAWRPAARAREQDPRGSLAAEAGPGVGTGHRDLWFRSAEPVPLTPFGELIYDTARRHRMSPRLVAAVVWVESGFDPNAVSQKGARGLMQVMPATAGSLGMPSERLFDPGANLEVGVRYLRRLAERYGGDLDLTLSAYNAGEGAVDLHRNVPPYAETRRYVRRVRNAQRRLR